MLLQYQLGLMVRCKLKTCLKLFKTKVCTLYNEGEPLNYMDKQIEMTLDLRLPSTQQQCGLRFNLLNNQYFWKKYPFATHTYAGLLTGILSGISIPASTR